MKQHVFERLRDSFLECKNLKSLVTVGMLTALIVILGFFKVNIGQVVQLTFGFIAIGCIAQLYGPFLAALSAVIGDVLVSILHPTGPYFVGFTIGAFIGGAIYGFFLYKQDVSFGRVFLATLLIGIIVNIFWNTFCVFLLYGFGFFAILPVRILKNAITIPFNSILLYGILKSMSRFFKERNQTSMQINKKG